MRTEIAHKGEYDPHVSMPHLDCPSEEGGFEYVQLEKDA